jgi:hypothetical protein
MKFILFVELRTGKLPCVMILPHVKIIYNYIFLSYVKSTVISFLSKSILFNMTSTLSFALCTNWGKNYNLLSTSYPLLITYFLRTRAKILMLRTQLTIIQMAFKPNSHGAAFICIPSSRQSQDEITIHKCCGFVWNANYPIFLQTLHEQYTCFM